MKGAEVSILDWLELTEENNYERLYCKSDYVMIKKDNALNDQR